MGRRKQSTAEDFMDLVALLPWWAGLTLAAVSYLLLHKLASGPIAQPIQMSQIMIRGLATGGQYIVPLLCLLSAVMSFARGKKRQGLFGSVAQAKGAESLNDMSWHEFEMLVGEVFRLQGFQVTELGGPAADGGVDLVLRKGTETHLVQCKQWKALKVGVDVVRQLYGVMAARGAASGYVVTSGTFTPGLSEFLCSRRLETCPRWRASLATNDRRGGQVGATSYAATFVKRSS